MKIGDKVFVHRKGPVPPWFRWQGLPCKVIAIETNGELVCHMSDGNTVSFYEEELEHVWSGSVGEQVKIQLDYPSQPPEMPASIQYPPRSLGGTSRVSWPSGESRCRECSAVWAQATNTMHCVKCHRTFSSPSACERHKTAGNVCRDPSTIKTKQGRLAFGDPITNKYGTEVWRQSGEGRPEF